MKRELAESSLQISKSMPGPLWPFSSPQHPLPSPVSPLILCSVYSSFKAQLRSHLLQEDHLEQSSPRNQPSGLPIPTDPTVHALPLAGVSGPALSLHVECKCQYRGRQSTRTDPQLCTRPWARFLQCTVSPSENGFWMGKLRYAGITIFHQV